MSGETIPHGCHACGALPCDWVDNPGWRPIESAPRDGTAILAILMHSDLPHTIRFRDGQWMIAWDGFDLTSDSDRPAHWLPLPSAPTVGEGR